MKTNSAVQVVEQSSRIQVVADPAVLAAALKAVRAFVTKDSTRAFTIGNVLAEIVPTGVKLTATDGHTLCSVTVRGETTGSGSARLTPIAVDTVLLAAKAAKGRVLAEITLEDCTSEGTFPRYEQVMPKRVEQAKGTLVHGFNGEYLARIGAVQKALKADSARCQLGKDAFAPLRADIVGGIAEAVVIIMPVRL